MAAHRLAVAGEIAPAQLCDVVPDPPRVRRRARLDPLRILIADLVPVAVGPDHKRVAPPRCAVDQHGVATVLGLEVDDPRHDQKGMWSTSPFARRKTVSWTLTRWVTAIRWAGLKQRRRRQS